MVERMGGTMTTMNLLILNWPTILTATAYLIGTIITIRWVLNEGLDK